MPITMPEERAFELVPAGTHLAVCRLVVDVGSQSGQYGQKRQILFGWELPDEQAERSEPFVIYRRYTLSSSSKSALRCDIEGWLGRTLNAADFGHLDLGDMLGRTCTLGVKHESRTDGKTFANVMSVMMPPRKTAERLPVVGEAVSFSLDDRPFRQYEFEALPQWIRELIQKSPEYALAVGAKPIAAGSPAERVRAHLAQTQPAPAAASGSDDHLDDDCRSN